MKKKTILFMILSILFVAMPAFADSTIARLPETAVLAAENADHAIYFDQLAAPTEDEAGVVTVWYKDKRTNEACILFSTNANAEPVWGEMKNGYTTVELSNIAAADKAVFIPGADHLVIIEGCPDARNIWTYIIDLKKRTAKQLHATEGLLGIDAEHRQIRLSDYRYHPEGGRYSVEKVFTYDGTFVSEKYLGEE
ncbi:MAG: hypothetical protein IKH14_04450 [Prevotella sp.]|nr:hypothetical protein [Prevotella sp.]